MIPIDSHTEQTKNTYENEWNDLINKLKERGYINDKQKYPSIYNCSDNLQSKSGYANHQYSGILKKDLEDLTSLQVAMLCDSGYSWFGGSCSKIGLNFKVKVYTD